MTNLCVESGCKASCCFSSAITFRKPGDYEKWLSGGRPKDVVEHASSFLVAQMMLGGSRREDGDGTVYHRKITIEDKSVDQVQLFGPCPNLDLSTFNCLIRHLGIRACIEGLLMGERECNNYRNRDGLDGLK